MSNTSDDEQFTTTPLRHPRTPEGHSKHEHDDQGSPRGRDDRRDLWITLSILVLCLTACLAGTYWYFSAQRAAAEKSPREANDRLHTTSQSENTTQSDQGTQSSDLPMSGRYPIGPDGKLLRPLDVRLPDPPSKPENMAFGTQEGAEAFNHYLTDLIEYMWLTGDTSKLDEIADPECEWCKDYSSTIKKRLDNQGWIIDASLTLTHSTVPEYLPPPKDLWHSVATIENSESYSYDGISVQKRERAVTDLLIISRYADGKWTLYEAGKSE